MPDIRVDPEPIDRSAGLGSSYADVLEGVRESVVSVYSSRVTGRSAAGFPYDDPLFRRFFGPGSAEPGERRQDGLGSGVIVTSDGYVLTNNHVVSGSDEIRVALADGTQLDAKVIGGDPRTDVAVIKVEADGLKPALLADSDLIRIGDIVFAVGNPLGIGQTTTMGIVSATGRANLGLISQGYEDFIQTDASINPGNSGGALVDAEGRVVGVNTAIITTSMGNIGIGFAIPINLASNILRSLIETGSVARGFLGVSLQDLDGGLSEALGVGNLRGVLVVDVQPGSPAEQCGLKRDDVIVSVGARDVSSAAELRLAISQTAPGSVVAIAVVRDGALMEVAATLAKLEDDTVFLAERSNEVLGGVQVETISAELVQKYDLRGGLGGVVVVEVNPTSDYAEILPVGTVIEQINRVTIADAASARAAMRKGRNLLLVNYRGVYQYLSITNR
jgi:serine protease Do/serine protease DegQ